MSFIRSIHANALQKITQHFDGNELKAFKEIVGCAEWLKIIKESNGEQAIISPLAQLLTEEELDTFLKPFAYKTILTAIEKSKDNSITEAAHKQQIAEQIAAELKQAVAEEMEKIHQLTENLRAQYSKLKSLNVKLTEDCDNKSIERIRLDEILQDALPNVMRRSQITSAVKKYAAILNKNEDLLKPDYRILKAILHTIATILTGSIYFFGRMAHSKLTRNSCKFWQTNDQVTAELALDNVSEMQSAEKDVQRQWHQRR